MSALAVGTGIAFGGRVAGRIFDLLRQAVVARLLSGTDFGIYALAITIFRMVTMIAPLGVNTAVIRFAAPVIDDGPARGRVLRTGIVLSALAGCGFALLMAVTADGVARQVFDAPGLTPFLQAFALALVFSCVMRVCLSITTLRQQIGFLVVIEELFQPGLYLLVIIGLTALGVPPLVGVIVGAPITFGLGMGLALWKVGRQFPGTYTAGAAVSPAAAASGVPAAPTGYIDVRLMGRMLRFGAPLALAALFLWSTPLIDRLLLGIYGTVEEAGVYVVVAQVATFFTLIATAIETIQSPMLARLIDQPDRERTRQIIHSSVRLGLILGIPALVVLALHGGTVLGIVFGAGFVSGGPSLVILSAAMLLRVISDRAIAVLVLNGHNGQWLTFSTLSFILNLILDLLLIPVLGAVGAALSTGVVNLFLLVTLDWAVRVRFGIALFSRAAAFALLIGAVSIGVGALPALLGADLPPIFDLIVYGVLAGGTCLTLLWRFILTGDERDMLIRAARLLVRRKAA